MFVLRSMRLSSPVGLRERAVSFLFVVDDDEAYEEVEVVVLVFPEVADCDERGAGAGCCCCW